MSQIIVFANQKGGVGKTTTVASLGAFLSEMGKRTLLVDFDPQSNLSSAFGHTKVSQGIYEVLIQNKSCEDVIMPTAVSNLSIIPSTIDLAGASVELIAEEDRNLFLKKALIAVEKEYDYILIDCPPSLGILTINGLTAAARVIIPLQCEYFALEGLTQLLSSIDSVQSDSNKDLIVMGIAFTMYDKRIRLAKDIVKEVVDYFGELVFRTIIPRNVRLSEAPSHGMPISLYAPECAGAKSYKSLAEEMAGRS